MGDEGRRRSLATVLVAGVANLLIALAKLTAGVLSGSAAMLAEGAHSVADTLNQVFLLAALRRSDRPADAQHPFGYGMERYFWALLAAVAIFVLGAGFSVFEGVHGLMHPEAQTELPLVFAVLGIAVLFDGTSLLRALWQVRREARSGGHGFGEQLFQLSEPTVRAVVFEDSAGVSGVLLAALGIGVGALTGRPVLDPIASLLIGGVLVAIAYGLGAQNRTFLIGRAVTEEVLAEIRSDIESSDGIESVVQLLTMQLGPDEVLVAARVEMDPDAPGRDLEQVADEVDERIRTSRPEVRHVFLDPTPARARHEGPTPG
ncbi:cation diffusion facilitator family transporter [Nocardioides terrisoli]|uniref:cation diffusion facilitator family transporter n=1 Tax=Nocardioides terrisoli TaxID=3388267 RepID=UPI00287BB45F|nr:cation diffusion facilitator family transporter [Nocardioides marmorisolisilvae]